MRSIDGLDQAAGHGLRWRRVGRRCCSALVALSRLGVDLLPDISYPSLTVRTDLPDAAPGDVEQFVTRPVEEGVGVVPGPRAHALGVAPRAVRGDARVRAPARAWTWPRSRCARSSTWSRCRARRKRPGDPALRSRRSIPILRVRLAGGEQPAAPAPHRRPHGQGATSRASPAWPRCAVAGGEEEEIQVEVDAARLSAVGPDARRRDAAPGRGEREPRRRLAHRGPGRVPGARHQPVPHPRGDRAASSWRRAPRRRDPASPTWRTRRPRRQGPRGRSRASAATEAVEIAIYKEGDANTVAVARAVKQRLEQLAAAAGDEARHGRRPVALHRERDRRRDRARRCIGGLLAILVLFAFLRDLRSTLIDRARRSRSRCSPPSSSCTASGCR